MEREALIKLARDIAVAHGVPPLLFEAMIDVESAFHVGAVSPSGAIGLGQIIPRWHLALIGRVAREHGHDVLITEETARRLLLDPRLNLTIAARILADNYRVCGHWAQAVARYHSGQCLPPADFVDGLGIPTSQHVAKVMAAWQQREQQEQGTMVRVYDIRNDNDAREWGLLDKISRNDPAGRNWRDYLLTRCFPHRRFGNVQGRPEYIVLHIQDGSTRGSLEHWCNGRDANGNPIQASATVMVNADGSVLRIIPEQHGPWTNGDVMNPAPQAQALLRLGGNPNLWCLTIEAEGRPSQPLTESQLRSIVTLCREWAQRYPVITLDERRILKHAWINSVTRAGCPGPYYDEVLKRLKELPTAPTPSAYAAPVPPVLRDGKPFPHFDRHGNLWLPLTPVRWVALKSAPRLQFAHDHAAPVAPPVQEGKTYEYIYAIFVVRDGRVWFCSRKGSRTPAEAFVPARG